MSVLLLTASFGAGHNQAASAISAALADRGVRSSVLDAFAESRPMLGDMARGFFVAELRYAPAFYRLMYEHAEQPHSRPGKLVAMHMLTALMGSRLLETVRRTDAQVVVCTHPFALGIMAALRRTGRLNVPLIGVLTDFAVHGYWVHPDVDSYCVATPAMREELMAAACHPQHVSVTGLPIRTAFSQLPDRATAANRFGLNPALPTVLVMGGGLGLGPLRDAVLALQSSEQPLQVVAVAGHNRRLLADLRALQSPPHQRLLSLGFVEEVPALMAAADVLVSKPGAICAAEAMAAGLPLLALTPVPGQEERNLSVLTAAGAARSVSRLSELPRLVAESLTTGRLCANGLARPAAAAAVAEQILGLLPAELAAGL